MKNSLSFKKKERSSNIIESLKESHSASAIIIMIGNFDMKIAEGKSFDAIKIKKRFDSEAELYEDLKENDFYGGEYKVRHTKTGYHLTAEILE